VTSAPRILLVSPIPSHPADQGNSARIQSFGAALKARGIEVDFFYYGMEGMTKEQEATMTAFWSRFTFMRSLALAQPKDARHWGIDDWCPAELCERVAEQVRLHRYDAVVVNYVWMSRILEGVHGILKVIDTHDLFGDRATVAMEQGLEPRWFFTSIAEEARGYARADAVLAIQNHEEGLIRDRFAGTVMTVGHPIVPLFLQRVPRTGTTIPFGYLGSGNPFNVRCVMALDEELSRVGRPIPWALAGTISRRNLTLSSNPARMGVVDSVAGFYDKVECILNPMLGGTGLKIKTIEALSFGKPIIGTPDAFEGLDPRYPLHCLETLGDFAAALAQWLDDPLLRAELAVESRRLCLRYMETVERQYDDLADLLVGGRKRGAAAPELALSA
jgi:glycosyltransferase involved in cell wall biosynthesis